MASSAKGLLGGGLLFDVDARATAAAGQTLRHLDWFEVVGIRGHVQDGAVEHFQVTMKVGFRLEDE